MASDVVKIRDCILLRQAIHEKDRKSLEQLHNKYYPRIKYYIASRIKSVSDTEDLIQDLFFELCKGDGLYDGQRDAEAYLFGMARNLISHYYRNKRKYSQTVQIETVKDSAVSYDARQYRSNSSKQLKKPLENAIEKLSPKAKEAFRARLIEGLTPKEAAKKLGCSTDAFYKRLDTALKALEQNGMHSDNQD